MRKQSPLSLHQARPNTGLRNAAEWPTCAAVQRIYPVAARPSIGIRFRASARKVGSFCCTAMKILWSRLDKSSTNPTPDRAVRLRRRQGTASISGTISITGLSSANLPLPSGFCKGFRTPCRDCLKGGSPSLDNDRRSKSAISTLMIRRLRDLCRNNRGDKCEEKRKHDERHPKGYYLFTLI
jgi:hypothetical protein